MLRITRREWMAASASVLLAQRLCAIPLSEIKLGVTTDEIDEDVATAVRFLKDFHLRWAEVRSIWNKYNTELPLDKIGEARSLFDEFGMHVSTLGTPFFKIPLPPDTPEGRRVLDGQWALLDRAMDRAKVFGTSKIRVLAFTYNTGETPEPGNYPRIYELVREAARRVKGRQFRLALENVGSSYVSTGAQAGELLKHIQDDNVGLTWDPNNAGAYGEQAFPDGYRKLDAARIFHVHLRDYRHTAERRVEWAAVGEGEFDNLGQIRALLKDGYKETFTLETHWRSPKGKAYATETSLKGLLKVIERV